MKTTEHAAPRPRIVFLVMSAVSPAETVDQLARALAPHTVLVHHDFTQTPDFSLASPNVVFVPDPKKTGWASFGFVEGIFHSLAFALSHLQFDYLQLLSPTCLPIRPLAEFESLVVMGGAEAHFGAIDMRSDLDCMFGVGYRAFTPEKSVRHRVLRRLSDIYYKSATGRRDEAGVWLRSGGGTGLRGVAIRALYRTLSIAWVGQHPFGAGLRPHFGSVWFGARRHIVEGMVSGFSRPGIRDYFRRLHISEEFLVPSLLARLVRQKGAFNHYINRFDEAHPSKIDGNDLDILRASGGYFARKFPDDPRAPVRLRVLSELFSLPATGLADAMAAPADAAPSATRPGSAHRPAAAPAMTRIAHAVKAARLGLHAAVKPADQRSDHIVGS